MAIKATDTGFDIEELTRKMTRKEKLEAAKRLQESAQEQLAEDRQATAEKCRTIIEEDGFSVEEIIEQMTQKSTSRKATSTGKKYPPKYRNPNNAEEVWSGQGRAPTWMPKKEHRDQWVDFLIPSGKPAVEEYAAPEGGELPLNAGPTTEEHNTPGVAEESADGAAPDDSHEEAPATKRKSSGKRKPAE